MRALLVAAIGLGASSARAATVRPDRPRILFSDGEGPGITVDEYRRRCTSDPAYQARCEGSLGSPDSGYPAIALAAAHVVREEDAPCFDAWNALQTIAADVPGEPDAHSFISNNGRTMLNLAIVRDWCDDALGDPEKAWLDDRIASYADWYVANADGLDVFHDDMNNVWNAVSLAALALAGTARDADAQGWLAAAETQWDDVVYPAIEYEGDFWHEGFTYVQPAVGSAVWRALAWSTATDVDVFAAHADLFEGYLAMHAYLWRGDGTYAYFGDTSDNKQSIELFSRWLVDAITSGTGSPLGQALSMEIRDRARPGYDYPGADGWLLALLYDASREAGATPRATLPTARWLSPGAADVAVLRGGFGPDDTVVTVSCGDWFGSHQHTEVGGFQIFRSAALTGSTGYYDSFDTDHWQAWYSQHSVHANTLAVYEPGEFFPTTGSLYDRAANVNDGGQRVLRRDENFTAYPNPTLEAYLVNKTSGTQYEMGGITTFESADCHDYVACEITAAYTSPGAETNGNTAKVTEVTRQFVFLRPDLLVVFDRVEATDAAYPKHFLLHAYAPPAVDGNDAVLTNGAGRLFARTLLPAGADVATIENFEVDGIAHPPSVTGVESGGTRIEVSPAAPAVRDYFLHVFEAAGSSQAAGPESSVADDDAVATVTITDGDGNELVVDFAKTGELGGHLVATDSGGTVLCDQDLGEFASTDADTDSDGDTDGDSDGDSDSDGDADAGDAADDGGCGCRSSAGTTSAWTALLFALVAARRRRR